MENKNMKPLNEIVDFIKYSGNEILHSEVNYNQSDVIFCIFCDEEINKIELTYTEDAEPAHEKCLENFNKHWEDRSEMMDLMGY